MNFLPKIYALASACVIAGSSALYAATPEPETDPFELDLETNINTPAVPAKKQNLVKESIDHLKHSLEKLGFKATRMRQGEVLKFSIACDKLFKANETDLSQQGINYLAKLKFPGDIIGKFKLLIAVHADDTGEQSYADALTAARANAIDDFITRQLQGIELIIVPYGLGHDEPLVSNDSVLNRAKNRRVDFYLVPTTALFTK
ncbi:MAG: hypothetical protein K2K94_03950 [Muribaculaceae bacterium]|nr:hypothetical protein [Muribaculaceae bacterium]